MEYFVGTLLLLTLIATIVYVVRGGNPFIAFFILAIVWAALVGVSYQKILTDVIEKATENYAPTILIVIFGSFLGQVFVRTGIAGSMIRKSVELGGDRPLPVLIISIMVVSFLFCTLYGVGCAIAVGVIMLPILMSIGIPPFIATAAYTMSIGGASLINVANIIPYMNMFFKGSVSYNNVYLKYAVVALAFWILCTIAMAVFNMRRYGTQRAWAVSVDDNQVKDVHPISYLAPVIPLVAVVAFKWPVIPSFILGVVYALITTKGGHSKSWVELVQRSFVEGVAQVGPIISILAIIVMFMAAAKAAAPTLTVLLSPILPHGTLALAIFFAICAPLVIYRGPMALFGGGAAMVAVLLQIKAASPFYIFFMFCGLIALQNCMDPTNSWSLWTIGYSKVKPIDHLKAGLPFAWVAAALSVLTGFVMFH